METESCEVLVTVCCKSSIASLSKDLSVNLLVRRMWTISISITIFIRSGFLQNCITVQNGGSRKDMTLVLSIIETEIIRGFSNVLGGW